MDKVMKIIFVCLLTLYFSSTYASDIFPIFQGPIVENHEQQDTTQDKHVYRFSLHGQLVVVDMDANNKTSKQSILRGQDLILVTLTSLNNAKMPFQISVTATDAQKDLPKLDPNHDGIIDRRELAESKLALLRFNKDGSIAIVPLAVAKINQIRYRLPLHTSKDLSNIDIHLITSSGKSFAAYVKTFD